MRLLHAVSRLFMHTNTVKDIGMRLAMHKGPGDKTNILLVNGLRISLQYVYM